jgi:Ran GTPase-activating protein (RanGAP) involved in mRNA processing and transport
VCRALLELNGIGKDSAIAIAEALRSGGAVLTSLNLYRNNIGPEGGKALAPALTGNAVLASLDVGYNRLDEEAALAIVRAVNSRDQMTSLGLAGCELL